MLGDLTRFAGVQRSGYYRWLTDPSSRRTYPERGPDHQSRIQVAALRAAVTATGADARAAAVVAPLRRSSPEFLGLWGQHRVAVPEADRKTLVHPELGEIEVDCQVLLTEDRASLLMYTASPGREADEKLRLLTVIGHEQFAP